MWIRLQTLDQATIPYKHSKKLRMKNILSGSPTSLLDTLFFKSELILTREIFTYCFHYLFVELQAYKAHVITTVHKVSPRVIIKSAEVNAMGHRHDNKPKETVFDI